MTASNLVLTGILAFLLVEGIKGIRFHWKLTVASAVAAGIVMLLLSGSSLASNDATRLAAAIAVVALAAVGVHNVYKAFRWHR